ncbi:NAD(P)-binding protein [Ceratobasidium sp. AG-I]|nr:NAD(P)-binding protein [Ceratobasidium sp. AG-I]
MGPQRIIAVCGATGTQGGSVISHLQRDGTFAIRALTRKPSCPRARELAESGVEVVYADYDDLESLVAAFRGCYGVFAVTNWFEALERERDQGFNLVRAAKTTNVQHFVLSTGEHTAPLKCPQAETKADTNDFLLASQLPRTSIYLTFYYSNMFLFDAIHKRADGALHMNLPFPTDSPIPSLAASDVGGFVLAAFLDPSKWIGQDMRLCTEYITPRQYATIFEEVSGIPVQVHEVTLDEFMQMNGNPYPSDVWSIFCWFLDSPATAAFSPKTAARIFPARQTWRQFALQHVQPTVSLSPTMVMKQEHVVERTEGGA